MIKKVIFISILCLSGAVFTASEKAGEVKPLPKGDPIRGEKLVGSCAACHGADGNSLVGMWPTLAGQRELYLFDQLHHIQEGERIIESMMGLLDGYNDDDLRDMAAYYASQKIKVGQASDENVLLGQTIYRAGNAASGLPACTGCHGPQGKGVNSAGYPALGGQKAEYVVTSLVAYKNKTRGNGEEEGLVMQNVASMLTIEEIQAVANYVSGLY